MTPENWDNLLLLSIIVMAIVFLILWSMFIDVTSKKMEPIIELEPIARERTDLNQKIRI